MRKFIIIVLIAAGSVGFGITSFAESYRPIDQLTVKNRTTVKNSINDEAKFLTVRDENGNEPLIKTIALVEFSDDGIRLKAGKPISSDESNTTISEDLKLFEE
jgi:hypothetical protein